jgi:hypothetical protein
MMITFANLEEELGSDDEPFFFSEEPETEQAGLFPVLWAHVCCLSVAIDLANQNAAIEKHWSEGPEMKSDLSGYEFKERSLSIAVVQARDIHLEHAEDHGFEAEAFLAVHALFAAHQAQWYGDNSGEYCESSIEDDLRWLRFFALHFSKISSGECECASQALAAIENIKEYATDLEVVL